MFWKQKHILKQQNKIEVIGRQSLGGCLFFNKVVDTSTNRRYNVDESTSGGLKMKERFEGFVGLISNIHKNIQKVKQNKMKEFGLSGNHVMCMVYLAQYPEGITAAKLCQLISVDKAATSRALSELLEKGYVRYPDADGQKKYRATVMLTQSGVEITKQMDGIICDVVDEIGGSLSDEERTHMYRALDIIDKNLEQLTKNSKRKGD